MSLNFDQQELSGVILIQGNETFLEYVNEGKNGAPNIYIRYKLIDSTSRNPSKSKKFKSYIGKLVVVKGTISKTGNTKVVYVRHIKGEV